uniref:Uncharacterized protein LOC111124802 isoform X3 n=1 Tax=Crassostrea virginica TaxID=6565 RepID=A0A8B8D848_CRAVI|nr:uncharacterized protein LOC111124802 isoform X3 [Crassostrea virginica]
MLSNCYQKFYTNQIHSSSLLCQLSTMWKSQVLCDAIIRAGSTTVKAHRVILVAACPMLQSMEKSSIGSHLEVRLASDITTDSINTFLQYLYEGFMMLTEENCREVEKIARLLQVDSIIKCCADFTKCVSLKTGAGNFGGEQYRYTFHDMIEFRHVRSSELQKTVQDKMKRPAADFLRAGSPKRPRHFRMGSPSDISVIADRLSMAQSYAQQEKTNHSSALTASQRPNNNSQKAVYPVEVVEDSIELLQTEVNPETNTVNVDEAVSVGISSHIDSSANLQVIDVSKEKSCQNSGSSAAALPHNPPDSITVNPLDSFANSDGSLSSLRDASFTSSLTSHRSLSSASSRHHEDISGLRRSKGPDRPPEAQPLQTAQQMARVSIPPSSPVMSNSDASGGRTLLGSADRGARAGRLNVSATTHTADSKKEKSSQQNDPDLSIVKKEVEDETTVAGLEMYVDSLNEPNDTGQQDSEGEEGEGEVTGDWSKEDLSLEGNLSTETTMWVDPSFKGHGVPHSKHRPGPSSCGVLFPPRQHPATYRPLENTSNAATLLDHSLSHVFSKPGDGDMADTLGAGKPSQHVEKQLTPDDFMKMKSELPYMDESRIHITESLQGKQKYCIVCKQLGRRTNDGTLAVRTRAKCSVCDVPLCKGPPRNCFRDFHEISRLCKYPNLQWTLL